MANCGNDIYRVAQLRSQMPVTEAGIVITEAVDRLTIF
jgi:hypothetical protein